MTSLITKSIKDNFFSLLTATKLASQIAVVAIWWISVFSLGQLLGDLRSEPTGSVWRENSAAIQKAFLFHLLILLFFSVRFYFLLFSDLISIRISQVFWLLGAISIWFYFVASGNSFFSDDQCMDCAYYFTFRYASVFFNVVVLNYLFLSILKQLIFGIVSIVRAAKLTYFNV